MRAVGKKDRFEKIEVEDGRGWRRKEGWMDGWREGGRGEGGREAKKRKGKMRSNESSSERKISR